MPKRTDIKSILVIGAGPIVIGQSFAGMTLNKIVTPVEAGVQEK